MLLTSLAMAMALQSSGETLTAIKNDDPETWVVEYPRLIRPFVVEYRQCLNLSDRRVTGEADFEVQHRADLPRCAEVKEASIEKSNAAMAGSKTRIGAEEVNQLFDNLGSIHVARGRDLDDQFRRRLAAAQAAEQQYEAERPRGLVLELHDASVVKARTDVTPGNAGKVE